MLSTNQEIRVTFLPSESRRRILLRLAIAMILLSTSTFAQESAPFASFVGASDSVLNDPHDLAFGPDGNLYIADKFANHDQMLATD